MPSGDGYRHDTNALTAISGHWRDGANQLDAAAAVPADAPDAGASSAVVGTAMASLIQGLSAAATAMDEAAEKVHAANGSYEDIENTNAGAIAARGRYGMGPGQRLPSDGKVDPAPGSLPPPPTGHSTPPKGPGGPGSMDDN
ncbi:hypothetical protein [Prauserella endophytica]|uniref:ESX-1 secretion-associated protein n=1 Tax=Prauserella endophytica TaxID=1592324 RepID=A0ABY2RWY4_9PSEU|nr:hypothetical protein [Prauserella endophytica]PXY17691.1 hypothetical protein BAY59_35770 [Prauserella coralliicola]TKG62026.1 hypothetical protein FCN18_32645 [Prauserella endophytica]